VLVSPSFSCFETSLSFLNFFSFTPGPFFLRSSDWSYSPLAWIQCLNIHLNRINTRAAWPACILHLFAAPFTTKHRLLLSDLALSSIHTVPSIVHCIIPHHAPQITKEAVSDSHRHCHATAVTIHCSLFVSRDASFIPTPQHQRTEIYISRNPC